MNLFKKITLLAVFSAIPLNAAVVEVVVPEELNPDVVRDAGNQALDEALDKLFTQQNLPERFAILPLQGDLDAGYFTAQLRNKFASKGNAAGVSLFTRMDDTWDTLLEEIQFGQDFSDTMDPKTIQKFGNVQGVQGIVMGRLESVTVREETYEVRVRITFQAYEVETGRFLWGTEATGSMIDENLRKEIYNYAEDAADELKKVDKKIWYWVGGGLVALILLKIIMGRVRTAARPR